MIKAVLLILSQHEKDSGRQPRAEQNLDVFDTSRQDG